MTITWKPTLGSGAYWKNGKCYGSGAIFNSTAHTIAKGTFDKSELNGNSCTLVNYDDTVNVSIRFGQFVDNKENISKDDQTSGRGKEEERGMD